MATWPAAAMSRNQHFRRLQSTKEHEGQEQVMHVCMHPRVD